VVAALRRVAGRGRALAFDRWRARDRARSTARRTLRRCSRCAARWRWQRAARALATWRRAAFSALVLEIAGRSAGVGARAGTPREPSGRSNGRGPGRRAAPRRDRARSAQVLAAPGATFGEWFRDRGAEVALPTPASRAPSRPRGFMLLGKYLELWQAFVAESWNVRRLARRAARDVAHRKFVQGRATPIYFRGQPMLRVTALFEGHLDADGVNPHDAALAACEHPYAYQRQNLDAARDAAPAAGADSVAETLALERERLERRDAAKRAAAAAGKRGDRGRRSVCYATPVAARPAARRPRTAPDRARAAAAPFLSVSGPR